MDAPERSRRWSGRRAVVTRRVWTVRYRAGAASIRLLGGRTRRRSHGRPSVTRARDAERLGFDSLWLSDHLFLDIGKYGGSDRAGGCVRADRHAGRARTRAAPHPARHPGVLRGAAAGVRARQGPGHPRPHLRRAASTSVSAPGGTSPSTPRSAWSSRPPACASPGSREAVDIVDRAAGAGRWPGRLRRPVPPGRRRAQLPCRRAAPASTGVHRRQGRPVAPARSSSGPTAGTPAGCGRPRSTRERREVLAARVRPDRARSRDASGARSVSTRCAARTRPTSSAGSSACAPGRPPGCSTA